MLNNAAKHQYSLLFFKLTSYLGLRDNRDEVTFLRNEKFN